MTYRELIELYKTGQLQPEQKEKVQKDIERQEAISEYLFENEEVPDFEDAMGTGLGNEVLKDECTHVVQTVEMSDDESSESNKKITREILHAGIAESRTTITTKKVRDEMTEGSSNVTDDEIQFQKNFTRMIKSSIRKAFIKMGIITGVIVIVIVCFIIFGLPKVVDKMYYNPAELVTATREAESDEAYDIETNRMELDMAVYSELFLPGKYREQIIVDASGYAKYDINIRQGYSVDGTFENVAGKVEKGKLVLYNPDLIDRPAANAFMPEETDVEDYHSGAGPDGPSGPAGTAKEAVEALEGLEEGKIYTAYVTLDDVYSYSEFVQWCSEKGNDVEPLWCALCQKVEGEEKSYLSDKGIEYETEEILGFIYSSSCQDMAFDEEKYPYLTTFSATETTSEDENWVVSEKVMKTHVTSLLRYMAEQKEFCEMMGMGEDTTISATYFKEFADNIEKHGMNIYGFVVQAQKGELIELGNRDDVAYIYTTPVY